MMTIAGKRSPRLLFVAVTVAFCFQCLTPAAELTGRQKTTRDRYEKVLAKNPFQASAFSRVYESYVEYDGLDAWITKLRAMKDPEFQVVLTRIFDRQLDHRKAIQQLTKLAGYDHPRFAELAGRVYYRTGDDEKAVKFLGQALDHLTDLDERSNVCRILGHIYLRAGNRKEAIEVWKKIVGENTTDVFALTELASIYEDNRMWDEAIGVYRRVIKGATEDPYRRCQALRQIGIAQLRAGRHAEAIAAYEKAFDLVAPGNWMFEDLKQRLVSVYQDQGDLKGLLKYLDARIETQPGDLEFRLLRAETYGRLQRNHDAEKELLFILDRRPRDAATFEELLSLYRETDNRKKVLATYEQLIELFPDDSSYLRRLGELHLRSGQRRLALTTWKMTLDPKPTAIAWSEIASWCEDHELNEDAIDAYEEALKLRADRDWTLRLADLKFDQGDLDGAQEIWTSLIKPDSSSAELIEVATILDLRSLPEESARLFGRALKLDPDDHETRTLFARSLMRQKRFEAALEQFEFLVQQDDNEFLQSKGELGQIDAWRGLGQLAQKQSEWETDLKTQTNNVALISRLIHVYERNGGNNRAIGLHERRARLRPGNSSYQRSLAHAYVRAKRNDEAIRIFRVLVQNDRTRARVHLFDLLDLYINSSLRNEAMAAAKEIVSLAPADPEGHIQLAKTMRLYQRNDEALRAYRHALRLNDSEPKYLQQFAELLVELKRWPEAGGAYERMLELAVTDESRVAALNGLAEVERENDRIDELVARFRARVRATPKKQAAYDDLAVLYQAIDRTDESIRVLEEGLKRVDDPRPMLRSLIRFAYDTKDFARVQTYYERLLDTRGKPSVEELERLARIYARTGQPDEAMETLNEIIRLAPGNAVVINRVAGICESLRYLDRGIELRERALQVAPDDRRGRYEYARALARKGEFDRAMKELYQLFDTLDPTRTAKAPRPVPFTGRAQINGMVITSIRGVSLAAGLSLQPHSFMVSQRQHLVRPSRRNGRAKWSGDPDSPESLIRDVSMLSSRAGRHSKTVTEWAEKIANDPHNLHLRRGLMTIFEDAGDSSGAAVAATDYAELDPDNQLIAMRAALYHTDNDNYDAAIWLLGRAGAQTNETAKLARQAQIAVLLRAGRPEKAVTASRKIIAADTNELSNYRTLAELMRTNNRNEYARELYEELYRRGGLERKMADMQLASIALAQGMKYEATERNKRLLLGYLDDPTDNVSGATPTPSLYAPGTSPRRSLTPIPGNLPGHVAWIKQYHRMEAFRALGRQLGDLDQTLIPGEMNLAALTYAKAKTHAHRKGLWEITKILCGHHLTHRRYDEMLKLLEQVGKGGRKDVEWFNLRLLAWHLKQDFESMKKVYEEFGKLNPGRMTELNRALAALNLASKSKTPALPLSTRTIPTFSSVRQTLSSRPRSTTGGSRVSGTAKLASIEKLYGRRKDLAMRLLESEISREGPSFEALVLLAEFQIGLGKTNEANKTTMELWTQRSRKHGSEFKPKSFLPPGAKKPTTILADPDLIILAESFRLAGRLPQLYQLVEQQAQKKPSKENLRELAHLYHFTHQLKKAHSAYEALLKQHQDPSLVKQFKQLQAALKP